jgi:hypothetical protein
MACWLGCADDPLDAESLEDCPATVTIIGGAGTTPSFSWQPTCRPFFVNVEPALSGTDLWTIISLGQNGIAPPVVYGQVPSGATELTARTALQARTAYKVAVARFTGSSDDDGEVIGIQAFMP